MIELGHICYPKLASTKFGDVAREELSADIAREVEKLVAANLAKVLGDILVRRIGLDLDAPTSEVSPGDTIVFPGGSEKSFPTNDVLSVESFAKELHVHTQAVIDDKSTEGVKDAVRWLSDVFLTVEPFYKHFGLIDDLETANSNLKQVLKDIQTAIDKAMADDDSLTLVDALKVVLTPPEPTESAQGSTKELEEQVTSLLNTIKLMEERAGQDQAQIASYKETAQDLQEHLELEQGRIKEMVSKYEALKEQLSETSAAFTQELNRERNENRNVLFAPLSRLALALVGTSELTEEVIDSLEERVKSLEEKALSATELQLNLIHTQTRLAQLENAKASESIRVQQFEADSKALMFLKEKTQAMTIEDLWPRFLAMQENVQQLETKTRGLSAENQILNAKCDGLWKEGQSQVNMLTSFILRMTGEETYSIDAFNRAMDLLGEAPEF